MKIVPSSLLKPTEKCIKVWNCSYIAVEGPNVLGNLSLEDIAIPYESQYRGRMVLNPNSIDQPLLFEGFLGTDVTFIMIKVTYDSENDEYYRYEKEKYSITYRYTDETTTRPIGRLLILTGSESNRVPQIYLNNPYEYSVTLDILMANMAQPDTTYTNINTTTFENLYYNSIISNESFIYGVPYTGSSQLVVLNDLSNPVLYIPYTNISSIVLNIDLNKIVITSISSEEIILKFLTTFDTYQAYSRMLWVQKSDSFSAGAYRFMTTDYIYYYNVPSVGVDSVPPEITYIVTSGTTIPSGLTLQYVHDGVSGWTSTQLKTEIMYSVIDNWDGDISFSDVFLTVNKAGSIPTLTGITEEGNYRVILEITDIANNLRSDVIDNVFVDSTPPVITYNIGILSTSITGNTDTYSGFTGVTSGLIVDSGFTMSISGQTSSTTEITSVDIRDYIIDIVTDNVDTTVDKYSIIFNIINSSGVELSSIISADDYLVKLFVQDINGNEKIDYLIIRAQN